MPRNTRDRGGERPAHRDKEWPPLAATGESPRAKRGPNTAKKKSPSLYFKKKKKKKKKNIYIYIYIYIYSVLLCIYTLYYCADIREHRDTNNCLLSGSIKVSRYTDFTTATVNYNVTKCFKNQFSIIITTAARSLYGW